MKMSEYLEAKMFKTPDDAHVPAEAQARIKNASSDDEAVKIALTFFKDPDDAEAYVSKLRG